MKALITVAVCGSVAMTAALAHTAVAAPVTSDIARVLVPTAATAKPGGGATKARLRPLGGYTAAPTQLRVTGQAVHNGREYLQVILPVRPNGTKGWVPADSMRVHSTAFNVRVNTRARMIEVRRGAKVVKRSRVVVGKPATPTPSGSFAVQEIVRQPGASGFYGPWVLTLTAHSNVLERFMGGPGLVAIHGRGGGALRDPLGSARSHGCVRIPNGMITWMARNLEPGVPVAIT